MLVWTIYVSDELFDVMTDLEVADLTFTFRTVMLDYIRMVVVF